MDIEERKRIAINARKETGTISLNNFGKTIKIRSKGDRDLVTDIDKKAEEIIIKLIKKNFPEDDILSEESRYFSSGARFKWIIDPIDGTHNYVHNVGIFGTSIALEFGDTIIITVTPIFN